MSILNIVSRSIYVIAAQGALTLNEALELSDRLEKAIDAELASRTQARRNQGLKTAMLSFCMAQGRSITSCMGVPSNNGRLDIESHGVLKKSVIDGPNRICVYDNAGSLFMRTVESTGICDAPL